MKTRLRLLLLTICVLGLTGAPAHAQPESGVTMVYPPGLCTGVDKQIEIGTFKPELTQPGQPEVVWTRNPRHFVEPCGTSIEKEFTGRYRIRVRCVDRETKDPLSRWVPSLSGLTYPWPAECPATPPNNPHVVPQP